MTKTPRTRKAKPKNEQTDALLDAVAFVSKAQRDMGALHQTHCRIQHGYVFASDGILAAGSTIPADIHACPHTLNLVRALERCEGAMTLTQTASGLSVKSDKFTVHIPCIAGNELPFISPDPSSWPMDNRVRDALEVTGSLASETGQIVILASVLLRGGSCVGTNQHVILEAWHGNNLPRLVVPKAFISSICSIKENIQSFGYTENTSLTVYFESGRWLKTQLYNDEWPNVDDLLNRPTTFVEPPVNFFAAIEKVEPFSDDDIIYFRDSKVWSNKSEAKGASYELPLPYPATSINPKYLLLIKNYTKKIDLHSYPTMIYFMGEGIRGLITGKE